jgi:hypothetical protein
MPRSTFEDIQLPGKIFQIDFQGFENARSLAPVSDDDQQFDYLTRTQVSLNSPW